MSTSPSPASEPARVPPPAGQEAPPWQRTARPDPAKGPKKPHEVVQFVLVLALTMPLVTYARGLLDTAENSVVDCEAIGGGVACRTSPEVWQYALGPLAAWILAIALFRGANVANRRRDGAGIPMSLAGIAVVIGISIWALTG